jgi:bifunctional non-homologous end joining protein LigD
MAFDMLRQVPGAGDLTAKGYQERYAELQKLFAKYQFKGLKLAPLALTVHDKLALRRKIREANGEGMVFKLLAAPYTAGRPASGGSQLKFKFVTSGTFIVHGVTSGKRSVTLSLYDGTVIGKVTIPANKEMPALGSIVEVRYLYCFKGGSLFQPVYLGVRDDIEARDCTKKQLKYKPDAEEEA